MARVVFPHVVIKGGFYVEPASYSEIPLPGCMTAKDMPHNQAIDSAIQGTAFLALKNAMQRCSGSILAVFEALYANSTKVDGQRAWLVDSRFGYDLFVVAMPERVCNGKLRVPLSIGLRCDDGHIFAARDWLTVCIGLD